MSIGSVPEYVGDDGRLKFNVQLQGPIEYVGRGRR
jgi:hypothetical protein